MATRRERRPALDGLRAGLTLIELALHAGYRVLDGAVGVDGFFVLSGYLISNMLFRELAVTGSIDLRRFYRNRFVRLFPALAIMIVGYFALAHELDQSYGHYAVCGTAALTYTIDLIHWGRNPFICPGTGHTWSLAIEEQFYLVWPVTLMLLVRRGRDLVFPLVAGIAISVTLLAVLTQPRNGPALTFVLPWTRGFELLLGCLLAVVFERITLPQVCWGPIAALSVAVFAWVAWGHQLKISAASRGITVLAPLGALLGACIVLSLEKAPDCLVARAFGLRPVAYLGRLTYGVYLYHFALFEILAPHIRHVTFVTFSGEVSIAVAMAALSYHFVEQPIQRRYRRSPFPSDALGRSTTEGRLTMVPNLSL